MTDLHGNVVGDETGTKTIQDAFRFDAYGETVCAWPSGGSALNLKWRHQGRLDISPNSDPLYAANARFYAPSAGVFTQLDSVSGSAQNPRSMNRFLYALANPATFVDPSGHTVYNCVIVAGQFICTDVDDPGAGGGGWTSTPVTDKPKTPKTDDGGGGDDGDGDDGDGAQLPEGPCADNTHWCGNTPPVEPEDVTYHRQFLQQCMSVFADLARCIKAWHAATDDTKVDGYTDMLIQLVLTNMDLPTNVVGMEVWSYVFRQEVKTNMALGLGRADAINFARSAVEHKLGDRAAMWSMGRLAGLKGTAEMGTKALGRLGIFTDAAYVFSQCHESLATCGLEAGRTAGIDALALRIGAAVGTGCLEGLEGGPIGCALLGTGVGVLTGVGLDAVLPHFSDQPSFAETWEAACLVSIGASTANNWCRS
jgi:RHS repeat-associated protein